MEQIRLTCAKVTNLRLCQLAAQTEALNEIMIAFDVAALEVVEQTTSLRNHLEQSAPRVVVLFVCSEMLREVVDALCEKRDLHLRRTRVAVVRAVCADNLFLCFSC